MIVVVVVVVFSDDNFLWKVFCLKFFLLSAEKDRIRWNKKKKLKYSYQKMPTYKDNPNVICLEKWII